MKLFSKKQMLLSLGTIATVGLPVATAVSCSSLLGANGRYDSDDDGKIVIQTTWSAGGYAISALEDVVEKYNASQKNTTGFIPVQIEHVEGGYGTIPSQIITKVQSHDTKTLPNLYIDYPAAVGQVNPYQMTFDMSSVIKRDWFLDQFSSINDKIAGVAPGGMYSVPLAKSTEALAIDKPLMKYLFETLAASGATIEQDQTNNPLIHKIMAEVISSGDKAAIVKQWGALKSGADASNITISDKVLTTYKGLFEFAEHAQVLFEAPGKPNVLGIDSPSNTIYELATLESYNYDEKFLFNKNKKTGYVDFNFLKAGTEQSQTFMKAYKWLKDAIDVSAMWVGGGGAYGSTRLVQHQMAISISSTAGLSHAFAYDSKRDQLNKREVMFALPINRLDKTDTPRTVDVNGNPIDLNRVTATVSQGPSINSVHITDKEDKGAMKFLEWLYTAKDAGSQIDHHAPIDHFAEKSSYIVPLKNAFDATSVIGQKVDGKDYSTLKDSLLGVKASYDAMKRENELIKANGRTSGFVDTPIDDMTSSIRKMIDSVVSASSNSKNNGGSSYDEHQLWNNIHLQAVIDQVIDGEELSHKYHYPNMMNRNFSDINWDKYSYVDAVIDSWIDGDTPKVHVTGTSGSDAVSAIHVGDRLSIRIAGIDTPEAHVKMGELKRRTMENGVEKFVGFTDSEMKKLIDKYAAAGHPLAVNSNGHYNALSMDKTSRYTYWKNIYVDIQTKPTSPDGPYDPTGEGYDKIQPDPGHPNSTYDFRNIMVDLDGGGQAPLITDVAKKEGYWGLKAGNYGRHEMPAGTKVRIATDGKKSYDRIVGSIFYGTNLSKNWSVEIVKKGLTLPFLSNPSAVVDKTSIFWQNGQAIADAFNYAKENRIGLYNIDPKYSTLQEHLKNILATHGATDFQALINWHGSKPAGAATTVYDYMLTRKPDPELLRHEGGN